nr:protein WVD2-like 7 [Tanacetum cinerariifolium]
MLMLLVVESVVGGVSSERQCIRQTDSRPVDVFRNDIPSDVHVVGIIRNQRIQIITGDTFDKNISTDITDGSENSVDNTNGSKIQPPLKRQCVLQSNSLRDLVSVVVYRVLEPYVCSKFHDVLLLSSILFFLCLGRFASKSLAFKKWSDFPHKRYVEEAKSYAQPVSRSGILIRQGSACDRDLRMLIPFRGCLLVRGRSAEAGPRAHCNNTVQPQRPDITRLKFRCLFILLSCSAAAYLSVAFPCIGSITDIKSVLTQRALTIFCETYHIPDEVHPQLPIPNQTIHEMPSGKIGVYTSKGVPKDPFPKSSKFNAEHFATLDALPAPFHKYPEPFLCFVGIGRYYTLDEDAYPEFLGDNDEEMDLLSFIRTADPTKVRVAERQRVKSEPRLLESTVGRVVLLLPIAPACASSELEARVDELFDEGASGDGQGTDIQPVAATTDTIVEDVASLQPRRQRKRKTAVADASGPSHPPKKLREDYGALGGASTAGKSRSAPHQSVKTSLADSVTGLNLRTIGAPQRSSAPAIANVTTVTAAVDADATAGRVPVAPSLFGIESSSTGKTDSIPGGFFDVSGSDFLVDGIRTVVDSDSDLQKVYVLRWSATNGFSLDDSRICREIEKRKLRTVVDEQVELLKVRDGEIESLKAQLLLKEAEAAEAIRLRAEVFKFEATEKSLQVKVREHEVSDLDTQVTAIKLQNDNLVDQVHKLEISSAGLQEKVAAYEDFIGQLEKFQDKKMEEVNEKFNKLCADFVDMALHLEENLYPHLLTTISRRRWLPTYGMELAVVKCLNSTEYLSALGAAISKAVEKGWVQPHLNRLMVPIHHSSDQRVVGASALSLSLDVSHSRVRKIRENVASHVSALRGVFVPLSEPLSAAALEGTKGGAGVDDETAAVENSSLFFMLATQS